MSEVQRQIIQTKIDATKSSAERNRLGQFSTPNALAIDIAYYVASLVSSRKIELHFADPSIGTGSFFSAALTVFGPQRVRSAYGIEVDPAFANAACDLWSKYGLKVICGDFTDLIANDSCPPAPNLILANPPYVRHHHLDRNEKMRLKSLAYSRTGMKVSGLAGLYVYFLLLATSWMAKGGLAAWLIPSEFMDVNYGMSLKRFLTEHVTLIRAHRFDPNNVQFGDAFVSSVVLVFRKESPPPGHAPEFTFGGSMQEPHASDHISLERLHSSRKWTIYPSHTNNDRLIHGGDGPLSDYFRIKRGVATGCNKFFILDRDDAFQRELPNHFLRPILPSPRHMQATVIEGDAHGYPVIPRQFCLVDCSLSESEVERNHPRLWEYLQTANHLGIRGGYLIGKRNPWYKQEHREPAPFLCTYMGRGAHEKQPFRFILNRSKAIGTNLYLMLYPSKSLATMLSKHPDRDSEVHELLNCVTGHELRGEGRVYGGGLHKIEPAELGRVSAAAFSERWPELNNDIERLRQAVIF